MKFEVLADAAKTEQPVKIVVIGTGGGGSNAIDGMIRCGVKGVKFVSVNTDIQALRNNKAETKIQIGAELTGGRGAGGIPEIGEQAALEDRDKITEVLRGADMVFVTACMGGGTGTGSAPIIAEVARSIGALTVGVVTKPFDYEKRCRMEVAEEGIAKLEEAVDSLKVIPNQRLINNADRKTSVLEAFRKADDILRHGVQGISDCIIETGFINIDFADVMTVMKDQGDALMTIGYGEGDNRVEEAISSALDNPLLEDISIKGATRALIYVAAGEDLPIVEHEDIVKRVTADMDKDAIIISGLYLDSEMEDKIRVTVIATGFRSEKEQSNRDTVRTNNAEVISGEEFDNYTGSSLYPDYFPPRDKREDYQYTSEDLDVPTLYRNRSYVSFPTENIVRSN